MYWYTSILYWYKKITITNVCEFGWWTVKCMLISACLLTCASIRTLAELLLHIYRCIWMVLFILLNLSSSVYHILHRLLIIEVDYGVCILDQKMVAVSGNHQSVLWRVE